MALHSCMIACMKRIASPALTCHSCTSSVIAVKLYQGNVLDRTGERTGLMKLDREAVLERRDNDHELYAEICDMFKHYGPELSRTLNVALNAGEIPVAIRHAHSLKSSSANIGAMELSELARQAEHAGKDVNEEERQRLMPLIDSCLSEVLA